MGQMFSSSKAPRVVIIGNDIDNGCNLTHSLKTNKHEPQHPSIHPKIEENIKIGNITVTCYIAGVAGGGSREVQRMLTEGDIYCQGIIYLTSLSLSEQSRLEARRDITSLLSTTVPTPILVLGISGSDDEITEEDLAKELYESDWEKVTRPIKFAITSIPSASQSEGLRWLSQAIASSLV